MTQNKPLEQYSLPELNDVIEYLILKYQYSATPEERARFKNSYKIVSTHIRQRTFQCAWVEPLTELFELVPGKPLEDYELDEVVQITELCIANYNKVRSKKDKELWAERFTEAAAHYNNGVGFKSLRLHI